MREERGETDMARVVWEGGCVAGFEVDGAGVLVADEDGGLGLTLVEVEPFFGLRIGLSVFCFCGEGKRVGEQDCSNVCA